MPNTSRITDTHSHGGQIIAGTPKVIDKGQPTSRIGDAAICNIHGLVAIATGNPKVVDGGIPTASIGDSLTCGAIITSGASNVIDG